MPFLVCLFAFFGGGGRNPFKTYSLNIYYKPNVVPGAGHTVRMVQTKSSVFLESMVRLKSNHCRGKCIITSLYVVPCVPVCFMRKSNKGLRERLMEESEKNQGRWVVREDSQTCVLRPAG